MIEFKVKTELGKNITVRFNKGTYLDNGNTYIGFYGRNDDEGNDYFEPWGNVTVNLDVVLPKDVAFIDVNNCDKNIILEMEKCGYIRHTGNVMPSGFVTYPLCEIDEDFLNSIDEI